MKIAFIGAGKMAEGILSAMPEPRNAVIAERLPERRAEIAAKYGVAAAASPAEAAAGASIVFLAVRPQDAEQAARETRSALRKGQTVVSIVAGRKLAWLRKVFGPKPHLVRVMPNLALRSKAGMCALCAPRGTPPAAVEAVRRILAAAGETVVLKEKDFDAVTALSGSGPAYFAFMEEAMAEGGAALGLAPDVARLLARQTMYGTAKFLKESGMETGPFVAGVCTKGGTTAAGMAKMARGAFKRIVAETLAAAAARSRELA